MSEETLLPYCSNCGCSITDFSVFYQVPCHHLYCHKCINSLQVCPIDKQFIEAREVDSALEREVANWKAKRTDSRRKAMYELINVNDVKCRVGKEHDLTKCVYDHSISDSAYQPQSWYCTTCNINIDIDKERCMFCQKLGPERKQAETYNQTKVKYILFAVAMLIILMAIAVFGFMISVINS